MSTKSAISIEEYLRTSFEDLDREYVDGEVVERTLPTNLHSKTQGELIFIFRSLGERFPLFARPELRSRVAATRVRIPDVSVYAGKEPTEEVPADPPLIAIEIISPDDTHRRVTAKLKEYRAWGVRHAWMVDPQAQKLYILEGDTLHQVESYEVPEYGLRISAAEIFR